MKVPNSQKGEGKGGTLLSRSFVGVNGSNGCHRIARYSVRIVMDCTKKGRCRTGTAKFSVKLSLAVKSRVVSICTV